jgi:hypothetical protein
MLTALQARMLFLGNSPYSTEQFAVQRNENIVTKIVQNKLFLQKYWIDTKLFLFILVLCCQGVICQFVRNVAMNRTIYNHAECFMRRFKLKISAPGTC